MPTYRRVLGVDVGTRGIRLALVECPKSVKLTKKLSEPKELIIWSQMADVIAIAGGYSWKVIRDHEIVNNLEKIVLKREEESEIGFRKILTIWPLRKRVIILPTAAHSPYITTHFLWNKIDVCTPDKVAKAFAIMRLMGLRSFTMVDKGAHTSILRVEDERIVGCIGASWGAPGKFSPGCVDYEVCYWYAWPRRKPIRVEMPEDSVNFWIEMFTKMFGGPVVICDNDCPYGEFSAAVGASLWTCEGEPLIGDDWIYYLRI